MAVALQLGRRGTDAMETHTGGGNPSELCFPKSGWLLNFVAASAALGGTIDEGIVIT